MSDSASKAPERRNVSARGLLSALFFVLVLLFGVGTYFATAFVVVPPIGAIPDGVTVWVWRTDAMNFIDSPDALCERRMGGVSLLCRATALRAMSDKIIVRLPYSETLYLWSTQGHTSQRQALTRPPSTERESPAEQGASVPAESTTDLDTTAPNRAHPTTP
ncbi:MAG: hypothetical protein Q8Q09_22320 [Deltaproteobacteria bacterium]|nr:hypothetical protein [Deltaproteobacteria bacterium]